MIPQRSTGRTAKLNDFYGLRQCPQCAATVFAAAAGEYLERGVVRLLWNCDDCAYVFATTDREVEAD